MNKIPILFIASEFEPSLSPRGVYLHALVKEINKTIRADVVTVKHNGSESVDDGAGFTIIRIGSDGAKLRNVLGFNKEASKLVKKEKYSHIIASSWEYAGSAAYNISKKTGIPYSLVLFDRDIIKLRGKASLFTKFKAIEGLAQNIFITSTLAAALLKKTGISSDKIVPVTSGPPFLPDVGDIDEARDSIAGKYNLQHPDMILFSKGISDESSAFDILLWTIFLLKQKPAKFSLFLSGDGKNRDKLEIIVKDLKLDEHIRFADDREDIIRLFSVSDIFISLTKGGKTVLVESYRPDLLAAMSNGKPVVVSASGNIKEYIADGETGFITPPLQPKEISAAIGKLMDSRDKRRKFGKDANLFVKKHYNWDKTVQKIMQSLKNPE